MNVVAAPALSMGFKGDLALNVHLVCQGFCRGHGVLRLVHGLRSASTVKLGALVPSPVWGKCP
jgi:hypothetical protein